MHVQWPVVIDRNLLDVEALPGDVAQFSVVVSGGQPYYFQWTVDGVVEPGATTAVLNVPVGVNDNGLEVTVCVAFGCMVSRIPSPLKAHPSSSPAPGGLMSTACVSPRVLGGRGG